MAARAYFFTFFGRGTGPKRSGAILVCFWNDCEAKQLILDSIWAIFHDLGPNRHFGQDLDFQAQARDWQGGPSPHFFLTKKEMSFFVFGGVGYLLDQQEMFELCYLAGSDPGPAFSYWAGR